MFASLGVSNYSRISAPASVRLFPRQTAQSLADTRGKNIKLEREKDNQLKFCETIWQLKIKFDIIDWWKEFRWISEFNWPLSLVSTLAPEYRGSRFLNSIKRNYAIVVIVVLSNQIKIKTNVGRTGPSERATDPQSPMSPDSAPDINIVKQISRDEET